MMDSDSDHFDLLPTTHLPDELDTGDTDFTERESETIEGER